MRILFTILLAAGVCCATAQTTPPLIPYPASVVPSEGHFTINRQTTLVGGEAFPNEQVYLQTMLRRYLGPDAARAGGNAAGNSIVLEHDPSKSPEAYRLSITGTAVHISAATPAGMFYAIQTLRQLLPASVENGQGDHLTVSAVDIEDAPVFAWRGMMLDVSRHFFSTSYVKKYIDMMAMYKMNRLHLHLTDDQGWRIEIKKYPRLTSESGWRTFNDQDSSCMQLAKETGNPDFNIDPTHIRHVGGRTEYGGFYTQEEMKDIIRYAAERHVEIIPEIDMPGHMMAAVKLYPELTCEGKAGDDWTHGFSTPICPCKDYTLAFAKDIFTEIAALFPSRYIHIGGDEVEKKDWQKSPLARKFLEEHHIASMDALQSYFNDYMQAFFKTKGKTLMGWDEIVEGGIDSSAAVMFWRPWARMSPYKATANGNKVVMTPDGPLYFDAWPDRNTLSSVYHYNPFDTAYEMNAAQQKNILGVQANLWTERVPTTERADYLVMPRMSALAELGWTHQDLYASYLQRLDQQYDRLDRLHIAYRLPDLPELANNRVFIDTTSFMMASPSPRLTIHYTLDGSFPTTASPVLQRPITIDRTLTLKVAAFTAQGRRGDVQTVGFDRQSYATPAGATDLEPGLRCNIYRGDFPHTTDIRGRIDSTLISAGIGIPATIPSSAFGLKFKGYIDVPETGIYSFFLTSNDGSVLRIAGRLVVDNDGMHADSEKSGQVALQKGLHALTLDFMDGGGGYALKLAYSKDDGIPQPIPDSWYKHDRN